MWSKVLERGQSSFIKNSSQVSMTWRKPCEAHKFWLNAFDAKFPNPQQKRLTLCMKSLHQSLECRLETSLCQKHWAKTILSKLVIFSNLLNSTGKKLEQQEGIHGYLSWWLKTSLWHRDRTQIASDWARGGESKTHLWWAETTEVVSQSFYVSSGVIFSENNDLWKISQFCESFRLR